MNPENKPYFELVCSLFWETTTGFHTRKPFMQRNVLAADSRLWVRSLSVTLPSSVRPEQSGSWRPKPALCIISRVSNVQTRTCSWL